jgi:hypothetical protein
MSSFDKICDICDKTLYVSCISKYTYKINTNGKPVFACSYSCFKHLKEKYPKTLKYQNRVSSKSQ